MLYRYRKEKLEECLIEHGVNINKSMENGENGNTILMVVCAFNYKNKNEKL